jgi:hypothetical protein
MPDKYYVRVTRVYPDNEHNYQSAYEVVADSEHQAKKKAKGLFISDFGAPVEALKTYSRLIQPNA